MCDGAHSIRGSEAFCDVTADGARFLVDCDSGQTKPHSITVEVEWRRTANKPDK